MNQDIFAGQLSLESVMLSEVKEKRVKKTALLLNLPLLTFGGYACNSQLAEKTQSPSAKTPPDTTGRNVQDRSRATPTPGDQSEVDNQLESIAP